MKETTSILGYKKVRNITMTENLEIRDDGYDGTILLLNPNGLARTILPTGVTFRMGYTVTIYNIGNGAEVTFDPNQLRYSIELENHRTFIFDGTYWRT